jgi:uncharacterized membrane protein YciS (DUF1049 family)
MYKYQIYVKVKGSSLKTIVFADNEIHARLLAQYQYGMNSLLSNPHKLGLSEAGIIKPLTPDQARIKSMKDQVKKTQQAIKAEKARQKIKAGQKQLAQNGNNQ